jgi:glycosyltransferase involved in cell wall biosynthesis
VLIHLKDTLKNKIIVRKKVTYILSNIDKAIAFEWIIEYINKEKFSLSFISIGQKEETVLADFCKEHQIPFYPVAYSSKKDIITATFKTFNLLSKIKPDAVHAHLFEAGLIGITAAYFARIKKRIYTRHYATQHHEYAPGGVKYDRIINHLSTDIIAISKNVEDVLINMENVKPEKITLIHHGFLLNEFENVGQQRIDNLKQKYHLENKFVVGVVSRYLHLKGIQYIIPAFKKLLLTKPDAHLVLANAKGEYKNEVKILLETIPEYSYTEIEFEADNAALFKCFDVFVHVPINTKIEAFGQIYIEALAAGIPGIFTLSGVAAEFIQDKKNALVVNFNSSDEIYNAIDELIQNEEIRKLIIENGRKDIAQLFSLSLMIEKLEKIYTV